MKIMTRIMKASGVKRSIRPAPICVCANMANGMVMILIRAMRNYWISLENIGNTRVDDVIISDNYPVEMTMDEGFDTEWWRLTDFQHDAGNQQFTAVYDYLYPGETTWFNFGAQIPGGDPLPPDQTYVNSVEVTAVPDETNTADNVDTAVLHSCMTPLEVTDLTLHIDGEDVVFNWSDIGADYYQIWWSDTNPYVEADPQCEPGIDSCEYTDSPDNHRRVGGASDPNANGYYRLIARNHCGIDNATDYTVGLFRFAIQAGDSFRKVEIFENGGFSCGKRPFLSPKNSPKHPQPLEPRYAIQTYVYYSIKRLCDIRQCRIIHCMVFIETSVFTKFITKYLSDDEYLGLQNFLLKYPDAGKSYSWYRWRPKMYAGLFRVKVSVVVYRVIYYFTAS